MDVHTEMQRYTFFRFDEEKRRKTLKNGRFLSQFAHILSPIDWDFNIFE